MWIEDDLYEKVKRSIPIPCVDLLVYNLKKEILLVKRVNEPAVGKWWFPGGRVLHGELRSNAAIRKLKEECFLEAAEITEMKSFDLFFDIPGKNETIHSITTVYRMLVLSEEVKLDTQSIHYAWKSEENWLSEFGGNENFVSRIIRNNF